MCSLPSISPIFTLYITAEVEGSTIKDEQISSTVHRHKLSMIHWNQSAGKHLLLQFLTFFLISQVVYFVDLSLYKCFDYFSPGPIRHLNYCDIQNPVSVFWADYKQLSALFRLTITKVWCMVVCVLEMAV